MKICECAGPLYTMKNRALLYGPVYVAFTTIALVINAETVAQTDLLPGVTYHNAKKPLSGSLVFLVSHDPPRTMWKTNSASIYAYDLEHRQLRKISDSPGGSLSVAADGRGMYAVAYAAAPQEPHEHMFIYSQRLSKAAILQFKQEPEVVALCRDRAFIQLAAFPGLNGTKIFEYDLDTDRQQMIEMTNASKWEFQSYSLIGLSRDRTNTVTFKYDAFGRRLADGVDYVRGLYQLDLDTGLVTRASNIDRGIGQGYGDMLTWSDQSIDGRYIFFAGEVGGTAPESGIELVSAPIGWRDMIRRGADTNGVRLLKTFTGQPGDYYLKQLSPDRKYAIVMKPIGYGSILSGFDRMGYLYTYYLVDVRTGETQIWVEDKVVRETGGIMSPIVWVPNS